MLQEKVNDRHGAIRLNGRTGTGGEVGRGGGYRQNTGGNRSRWRMNSFPWPAVGSRGKQEDFNNKKERKIG